jgi:ABC-type hemin transport system ATPase subunit
VLKVRKHKLAQNSASSDVVLSDTQSNSFEFLVQDVIKLVTSGTNTFESGSTIKSSTLLEQPVYQHLTTRAFSSKISANLQIPAFLLTIQK